MRSRFAALLLAAVCSAGTVFAQSVGGPCTYSKYTGTAVITRLEPDSGGAGSFSAYFRFSTLQTIAEQWAAAENGSEKNLAAATGLSGKWRDFRIKTGNSYACTLMVITSGACSPLIYRFKAPDKSDAIDTATMWTEPGTAVENRPFTLNLLSYDFDCLINFYGKTDSVAGGAILLAYKVPQVTPAIACPPADKVYGIPYALPALTQGKYPVYAELQPACYPLCKIAVNPVLVDTLVVVRAASVLDRRGSPAGAGEKEGIYSAGKYAFASLRLAAAGAAGVSLYTLSGKQIAAFKEIPLAAGRQRIAVPLPSFRAEPLIVKLVTPDNRTFVRLCRGTR